MQTRRCILAAGDPLFFPLSCFLSLSPPFFLCLFRPRAHAARVLARPAPVAVKQDLNLHRVGKNGAIVNETAGRYVMLVCRSYRVRSAAPRGPPRDYRTLVGRIERCKRGFMKEIKYDAIDRRRCPPPSSPPRPFYPPRTLLAAPLLSVSPLSVVFLQLLRRLQCPHRSVHARVFYITASVK